MMGAWTVGHNLAGYMPESDVLAFEDYQDALSALVEEMRYYADSDDEAEYAAQTGDELDDEQPAMLAQVEAIVTDEIKPGHLSGDVGFILEDNSGRMISFWLQWSDESDPDDDDEYPGPTDTATLRPDSDDPIVTSGLFTPDDGGDA